MATTIHFPFDTVNHDNGVICDANKIFRRISGFAELSAESCKYGDSGLRLSKDVRFGFGDATPLPFGTADFCIDCWVRIDSRVTNYPKVWVNSADGYGATSLHLYAGHMAGNQMNFQVAIGGSGLPNLDSTSAFVYGQYTHVRVNRSGNTFRLFINGVCEDTYTGSLSLTPAASVFYLNGLYANGEAIDGAVDDFRLVLGDCVSTANFTPARIEYTLPGAGVTQLGDFLLSHGTRLVALDADRRTLKTLAAGYDTPASLPFYDAAGVKGGIPINASLLPLVSASGASLNIVVV